MKHLLASLGILLLAPAASAATLISILSTVGTSDSTAYTPGQSITVTYYLADYSVTGDPVDAADEPAEHDWWHEEATQPPIYGDVTLTGAQGSFATPAGNAPEMYLYINAGMVPDLTYFMFLAGADEEPSNHIGLTLGGDPIRYMFLGIFADTLFTGLGQSGTNPEEYLSTAYGTYSIAAHDESHIELASGNRITLLSSSMTIAQVPEPSALALGALALGIALRRQRRK